VGLLFVDFRLIAQLKAATQVPALGNNAFHHPRSRRQEDLLVHEALGPEARPVEANQPLRAPVSPGRKCVRYIGARAKGKAVNVVLVPFEGDVVDSKDISAIGRSLKKEQGIAAKVVVVLRQQLTRGAAELEEWIELGPQSLGKHLKR